MDNQPSFLSMPAGEPLPNHVIIGETGFSPGDRAVNLWPFYERTLPVNIMSVGETDCTADYHVIRPKSGIMAIEYIIKGAGTLEINGKTYRPGKNCAILLTKHSKHAYSADPKTPWKKYWIVFDGPFMQNMIDTYLPKDEYCFPDCGLEPYFHKAFELVHARKKDYYFLLDSLSVVLFEMVLCINRQYQRREVSMPEKIRMAMDAQIEGKLSLEAISKEFSYSKNHIISIFSRAYGITPYRYFGAKKIDVAKLYLCNTSFSLEEISQMLSYADRNYFSNCFKKHTGYSPAQYRKLHQLSQL